MKSMIINHQKNRYYKIPISKYKELLYKRYCINDEEIIIIDHIIPFCITNDSSYDNLQLLTKEQHLIKTRRDFKILKQLREEGYYERVTKYSTELLKSKEEIIKRYLEILKLE